MSVGGGLMSEGVRETDDGGQLGLEAVGEEVVWRWRCRFEGEKKLGRIRWPCPGAQ
jgi:hypothetical protein